MIKNLARNKFRAYQSPVASRNAGPADPGSSQNQKNMKIICKTDISKKHDSFQAIADISQFLALALITCMFFSLLIGAYFMSPNAFLAIPLLIIATLSSVIMHGIFAEKAQAEYINFIYSNRK